MAAKEINFLLMQIGYFVFFVTLVRQSHFINNSPCFHYKNINLQNKLAEVKKIIKNGSPWVENLQFNPSKTALVSDTFRSFNLYKTFTRMPEMLITHTQHTTFLPIAAQLSIHIQILEIFLTAIQLASDRFNQNDFDGTTAALQVLCDGENTASPVLLLLMCCYYKTNDLFIVREMINRFFPEKNSSDCNTFFNTPFTHTAEDFFKAQCRELIASCEQCLKFYKKITTDHSTNQGEGNKPLCTSFLFPGDPHKKRADNPPFLVGVTP